MEAKPARKPARGRECGPGSERAPAPHACAESGGGLHRAGPAHWAWLLSGVLTGYLLFFLTGGDKQASSACPHDTVVAAHELIASDNVSRPPAAQPPPPPQPAAEVFPWDPRPGKASVIFWGAVPEGPPPPGLVYTDVTDGPWYNSGNEVWATAARRLVDPDATHLVSFFDLYDEQMLPIPHPVDNKPRINKLNSALLLLPVANMLWLESDFAKNAGIQNYTTQLTAHIRLVNKSVLLVGIGTQGDFVNVDPTKLKEQFVVPLHSTQVEFLQEVEKRAPGFAVRGRVTKASCLAKGLVKPRALGCPSLFLNHDPLLGQAVAEKFAKVASIPASDLKLAVTLPASGKLSGNYLSMNFYNNTVKLVAERVLARFPNSFIVIQTLFDYKSVDAMCTRHGVCLPAYRVRFYYDPDTWVAALRTADLVVGYRCACAQRAVRMPLGASPHELCESRYVYEHAPPHALQDPRNNDGDGSW